MVQAFAATAATSCPSVDDLAARFADQSARVGIVGLGYVGLPLAVAICASGLTVLGFDTDPAKVEALAAGRSYIRHVTPQTVAGLVAERRFEPTAAFDRLGEADAILVCVPTPLDRHRDPDLSYVVRTTETIAAHLQIGRAHV